MCCKPSVVAIRGKWKYFINGYNQNLKANLRLLHSLRRCLLQLPGFVTEKQIGYDVQKFVLCVKVSSNKKKTQIHSTRKSSYAKISSCLHNGNKGATNNSKAHKMTSRLVRSQLPIMKPTTRLFFVKYVYTIYLCKNTIVICCSNPSIKCGSIGKIL